MTCTSPHLPLWSVSFVNPWGPSAVIGPDLVTWRRPWALIDPLSCESEGGPGNSNGPYIHIHRISADENWLSPARQKMKLNWENWKYLFFSLKYKSEYYMGCIHLFHCHSLCFVVKCKCCKRHRRPVGSVQCSWGCVITSCVEVVDIILLSSDDTIHNCLLYCSSS